MTASDLVHFGPFRLDPAKRVLWRGEELVPLPPKALDLLVALVEARGDVVPKEDLMARVWPDVVVEEANLSVNVSILRKLLDEQADGQPYIQTVPRRGYRFLAALSAPAASEAPRLPALAVLPFRFLGAGSEDAYLGVGLADALITRLAGTGQLVVRPTRSVLKYEGSAIDPRQAGRELQADAVLDGTVQLQAGRLRLTLQLVPLGDTPAPWSGRFEESFTNVFAVQDAMAEQVAAALALRLGGPQRQRLVQRHTQDVAAFQAYTRGRYFWNRFTGKAMENAFGCFVEAVEHDPEYALPHAGLADLHLVLGFSGAIAPRDAWPMAASEARLALERDEGVADAHVSLGYVRLFSDWEWRETERELRRALELDPQSAAVRQWWALYLDMCGRFDEARAEIERSLVIDPLSLLGSALAGFQFNLLGERERELAQFRRTVELDPNHFLGHWGLGLALQHQGQPAEALDAHRRAVELAEGTPLLGAVLARSLVLAGQPEQARSLLAEQEANAPHASAYQRATVYAALGEQERALECLEAAGQARDPWLVWLAVDPMLAGVRGAPRFEALRGRVFGE